MLEASRKRVVPRALCVMQAHFPTETTSVSLAQKALLQCRLVLQRAHHAHADLHQTLHILSVQHVLQALSRQQEDHVKAAL